MNEAPSRCQSTGRLEAADGGTIFLDGSLNCPRYKQKHARRKSAGLSVSGTRSIPISIIATNQDLMGIAKGHFGRSFFG